MKNFALATLVLVISAAAAMADSCWWHNGSLMRLQANGNERNMYYETPRQGLRNAGVRRGTLLFNGTKNGNWYSGLARVFSSTCVGNPLEYWVEGPVAGNQARITVRGTREKSRNCVSTGVVVSDTLVFNFAHFC